jgi:hypothetical protein
MLLANGAIPEGIDPEQFVTEMFDPGKSFRGLKTDLLRQQVRPFLLPREEWLLKVPIGFLHTEGLNPFSVRAPSGGKAILMDNGIGLSMYQLGRSVLALTTWSAPEPYCHDHRPESWVNTILALAAYACYYDDWYLQKIRTWRCPSLDEWEPNSVKFAMNVELFLLLHEYGHIIAGHLDNEKQPDNDEVLSLQTDHTMEFAADEFSFSRHTQGSSAPVAALAAATILRFLDLTEHFLHGHPGESETHPAARERQKVSPHTLVRCAL